MYIKYFGRVLVELVEAGTPLERMAYVLAERNGTMRELRWQGVPVPRNLDNSPFKKYIGKDVVVEGQPYNATVIIVFDIRKFP